MKSLRQIVELKKIDLVPDPELQAGTVSNYANPKSDAERRFVEKHVDSIQKTLHPAFKNEAEPTRKFCPIIFFNYKNLLFPFSNNKLD